MIEIIKNRIPTLQQKKIIEYKNNLVVLAKPGSGKTYTIAEKIRGILDESISFKGVIAISFTNKASKELKNRVLIGGVDKKGSFFDTMTTFYLMEIIYPFGVHVFGNNVEEFEVAGNNDDRQLVKEFRKKNKNLDYKQINFDQVMELAELYKQGIILIESIDAIAVHIFDFSLACRRYIKSRYSHIFIDEYQDCGFMQNQLFIRLVNLGLVGIAVGDKDQSIYGFAEKSSVYLIELASKSDFKPFYLDKNFRCHSSISNYSLRLLNGEYEVKENNDIRVIRKRVNGKEANISNFIDETLPKLKCKYGLENNNQFAVLVKSNHTGELIAKSLRTKNKFFKKTELDDDSSLWASVFKNLLMNVNSPSASTYEFVEEYYDPLDDESQFKNLYKLVEKLKNSTYIKKIEAFIECASYIYPNAKNKVSISKLEKVLSDDKSVESFTQALVDEIQIMTVHKSKGLEFPVVFHLNLHKFILPEKCNINGVWGFKDFDQCRNLHYVGVTRAEELCILVTSTERTNYSGEVKKGEPSEFFKLNNLVNYSRSWTDYYNEL
ncbi:UvrD-helicase domain-containing protein [Acetobacterium carbinolicum]|uniref:UvrD-helicase domain-containing protein n=1 Tax=Acetobacterium carbinolicum TaxID=52690 RepID=UPI003BF57636